MCPQGNKYCENDDCTCDPCESGHKTGNGPDGIQEQCSEVGCNN